MVQDSLSTISGTLTDLCPFKFSQIIISILYCIFLTELKGSVATDELNSNSFQR